MKIHSLGASSKAEMFIARSVKTGCGCDLDLAVEAISAPDLRELERVMSARSLLGIPVRRRIILYADGSSLMSQTEAEYEDL